MINVRAETVAEKPSFRSAYRSRRCLVPADGFYGWKHEDAVKQPYHIRREDRGLFCSAGLWKEWAGSEATISSCAIITTESNRLFKPIHLRMPVVVQHDDYGAWLDGERSATDAIPSPHERVGFAAVSVSS